MTRRRIVALMAMLLLGGGVSGCGSESGPVPAPSVSPAATEKDGSIAGGTAVATLSIEGMT